MTNLREHWEGASLSGDYTLEQWLAGDDKAAFFKTSLAPDGRRAVVKIVPEDAADSAARLDLWQRTRQLRHPNLIELMDCGAADQSGEIVLYAVFESPDDSLATALSQGPLNRQESREVLDSILDALRYLHAQGLVLGALEPDNIVAVGDRIKLSTDALRDADTSSAYAEDVRLLGNLWTRVLMPASSKSSEIAAHAADPNPQARWSLAEISAALNAAPAAVSSPAPQILAASPDRGSPISVPPVSSGSATSGSASTTPDSVRAASVPLVAVPPVVVRKEAPALPPSRPRVTEPATPTRFPTWIFGAAGGALLLLILGLNLPRRADVATQSRVAPVSLPAETPVPAPLPKAAVPHAGVPKGGVPKAAIPKIPGPTVPQRSPVAGKEMWRVIAFTYRTREPAAKKVDQLNQLHPGLHAAIFSPKDKNRGYYLVSLGGRMNHEEAVRLRRSARGKGLPRDLYVQNYSE